MLVKGILLLLIEGGVVGKENIIEAIEGVIEIKREVAGTSENVVVSVASIGLLRGISASLSAAPSPAPPLAA